VAAGSVSEEAERLVEAAADALERGDLSGALASAEAACDADPRSVPACHYRAAALAELSRTEEAVRWYERALAIGPNDLDLLLGAADLYVNRLPGPEPDRDSLERGLELARRGAKLALRAEEPGLAGEFALLEGMALNQLGDARAALPRIEAALADRPDDREAGLERGLALYELCRFDEARAQLLDLVRAAPDEAWAHHTLGLIAARQGDRQEAARRLERARRLAPEDFPPPTALSPAAFDAVVEEALASLPEPIRRYLSNVAIAVEDVPADDDLLASDPPLSPSILGIFRGAPLGQKGSMDPWSHFPSSIVLYQGNLQAFARSREELVEQIRLTLIHEVGHFLGLDEEELWRRGLD
jgi:predicted Zn-dependent protease with MMP-like domain/Flp pilus assembly protein TadD